MINENQLIKILTNNQYKIKNTKTFFGSPLKKFINNIYHKLDIPQDSFIASLFYLYKYYNKNKCGNMQYFFDNINLYIFCSIIIYLKNFYDEPFDVLNLCTIFNIEFEKYKLIEKEILLGINWETFYENEKFCDFKKIMAHYMDSVHQMDFVNYKYHYLDLLDH